MYDYVKNSLTLILLTPLETFSLSPENQNETDLSHLGNLKYTLSGHFDEKIGGTPF